MWNLKCTKLLKITAINKYTNVLHINVCVCLHVCMHALTEVCVGGGWGSQTSVEWVKNAPVQFMKLTDNRGREIPSVWNEARSKELNDMGKKLGIFISHLLVMG